jgi:hypothetical protein
MQPGAAVMVIMLEQIRFRLQHEAVGHQAVEHLVKGKLVFCSAFGLCRGRHNRKFFAELLKV